MKRFTVFFRWMFNSNPVCRMSVLNKYSMVLCCGGDSDDTHPEDDDYNGGGNYDGW